jgi:hypothetical protein
MPLCDDGFRIGMNKTSSRKGVAVPFLSYRRPFESNLFTFELAGERGAHETSPISDDHRQAP